MRRFLAFCSAAVLATGACAGSALATHGGAEHRATGSGAAAARFFVQTPIFAQCFFGLQQVGLTTTTTDTAERFSFNARLTTEEAEDLVLSEPHGQMRLELAQTVTTSSSLSVPFGCFLVTPVPPNQTVTRNATATADVTCLTVVNNRAAIGGRVTRFDGDFPPTRGLLFNATDNTIANQQVVSDQFSGAFIAEAPQVCPAPSADHPITEGDIVVAQS